MITITATEFKAKCLELMDTVSQTGEVFQITKRGKVIAELRAPETTKPYGPGYAKGTIQIVGDIMAPYDVEWDAMRDDVDWEPKKDGD